MRPQVLPEGSVLESGTPVTNSSTSGFGRLDVGPGDILWVGGLPQASTPGPPVLKTRSTGLTGCLHRVVLDGHAVGLWNFASQSAAGCAACIQRSALDSTFVAVCDFYKWIPYWISFHICLFNTCVLSVPPCFLYLCVSLV